MWILTRSYALSIVRKLDQPEGTLTVRARVKADLEAFIREVVLSTPGVEACEILEHTGTDYPYRAILNTENVASTLYYATLEIDYPNFKAEVSRVQGVARSNIYGGVWAKLLELELERDDCKHPHIYNGVCQYCGRQVEEDDE